MAASVAATSRAPAPRVHDASRVQVELARPTGSRDALGTAREALRDRRLTRAERAAIEALVRAVGLLRVRARLSGIDDAGTAVRLVLRDPDAATRGPWATVGTIAVGSRNGLAAKAGSRARPGVLITVDAAVHELAHVVQFARIPASATPHAAILEGIADTVAMLATGDDTLGEGFFVNDASGRPRGSIRELGARRTSGPAIGGVVRRYEDAIRPGTGEHAAGGVVSHAFARVRSALGRDRAEQLVWAVIRDTTAWQDGGSWRGLVAAIHRAAAGAWPGDAAARAAVDAALAATGLDAALRAEDGPVRRRSS